MGTTQHEGGGSSNSCAGLLCSCGGPECCVREGDFFKNCHRGAWRESSYLQDTEEGEEVLTKPRLHCRVQDGINLRQDVLRLQQDQHYQQRQKEVPPSSQQTSLDKTS